MFNEWFENHYFVYIMSGLCAAGLLIKLITNLVYLSLVHASATMSTSKNKLIKLMKMKFETFYKLKIGVNNVDIFVDKYVYRHRFCGLLLSTWENLSGLMFVLCLLIGPVAAIFGVWQECGQTSILCTLLAGACTSSLLLLVDNLFNLKSKKRMIKVNMRDYLENFLKARLEQEALNPDLLEQYRMELSSNLELTLSPHQIRKREKKLEKQQLEQEKLLAIEAKQQERENKKRARREEKLALQAQKEEERLKAEEDRRLAAERKAEEKRRLVEEKRSKARVKADEEQLLAQRLRQEDEERATQKRQENAKRLETERKLKEEVRILNEKEKEQNNEKVSESIRESAEFAASQEQDSKKLSKTERMKVRNERLKEEIAAQREQRAKDREAGVDPFESYNSERPVQEAKNYHVNDFDMAEEMKKKALEREESAAVAAENPEEAKERAAVTKQDIPQGAHALKGNSPYEDKVIGDILKEFLA